MIRVVLALLFLMASGSASAEFACEKIKEKAVRSECIADREKKLNEEKDVTANAEREAVNAAALADEKAKALESEKNKARADFVLKAKESLTRRFLDPAAAQFSDLLVAQGSYRKTLCGSVNGKNAYGGYVGLRRFTVTWVLKNGPYIWIEFENTATTRNSLYKSERDAALATEAAELETFRLNCQANNFIDITNVEN